ncbi:MAG: hypothetical protein QOJ51_4288, partial [Acidobacteriaceae bacterium]|nr:hypothetical protein [Acidobacteriaceae bacterium]
MLSAFAAFAGSLVRWESGIAFSVTLWTGELHAAWLFLYEKPQEQSLNVHTYTDN